jgi:hypothetical protein
MLARKLLWSIEMTAMKQGRRHIRVFAQYIVHLLANRVHDSLETATHSDSKLVQEKKCRSQNVQQGPPAEQP